MTTTRNLELRLQRSTDGAHLETRCELTGEHSIDLRSEDVRRLVESGKWLDSQISPATDRLHEIGAMIESILPRYAGSRSVVAHARDRIIERDERLRVVVRHTAADPLIEIPWESMVVDDEFIALEEGISFLRYVEQKQPPKALTIDGQLRIMLSRQKSFRDGSPVKWGDESILRRWEASGPRAGRLLEIVRDSRIDEINRFLARSETMGLEFHAWHHAGHGGGSRTGHALELDEGAIPADAIASRIVAPSLKLVVLASCHAGESGGLVARLAALNFPSLVGFRAAIPSRSAESFSRAFYARITDTPLDEAVDSGRRALAASVVPGVWATLVAFVRTKEIDSDVLRLTRRRPAPISSEERHGK